jgi:hypothetical protein
MSFCSNEEGKFEIDANINFRESKPNVDKNLNGDFLTDDAFTVFYDEKTGEIIPVEYLNRHSGFTEDGRTLMVIDGMVYSRR